MKITKMRKGSKGLVGTYENIKCHAEGTREVVDEIVAMFKEYPDAIKEWKQGHNVHIVETWDGRKLVFTPYQKEGKLIKGVLVSLYVSRGKRIPLYSDETGTASLMFLPNFLMYKQNFYGVKGDE